MQYQWICHISRQHECIEKNGRVLSFRCTKHIKTKYFLIKDYYDAGKIDVRFCATDKLWADVLTKPLQGQKFRDMWAFLQNCPQDYDDDNKLKKLMNLQDAASLRVCVSEYTKSLLKSRPASPTCISQIADTYLVKNLKWLGGETRIHLLCLGWRNFFSSCAVVSVFCSGGK